MDSVDRALTPILLAPISSTRSVGRADGAMRCGFAAETREFEICTQALQILSCTTGGSAPSYAKPGHIAPSTRLDWFDFLLAPLRLGRRALAGLALAAPLLLAGCANLESTPAPQNSATVATPVSFAGSFAADSTVRQALAPTGTLRVGVYPGSPTSLVVDAKTGQRAGIALDLGTELARQLAVPVQVVEFQRVAQVIDALKANLVDVTFTNATVARGRDLDFGQVMVQVELGYLVPGTSPLRSVADVDRPGVRVGVTQGSSSQVTLGRLYTNAALVPSNSMAEAQQALRSGAVQAYATNKAVLSEMGDTMPGYRILDGRWGVENMALAIPKGRDAGQPWLRQFAAQMQAGGQLKASIARAGLRGSVQP